MNQEILKSVRPLPLYAAMLVVVSGLLFVFVAGPLRKSIVAENDEIQKLHANMEFDQRRIADLPKYRGQAAEIGGDESRLRFLLSSDRVVDFIRDVEGVAKTVGGAVTITQGKDLADSRKSSSAPSAASVQNSDPTAGDASTQPAVTKAAKSQPGSGLIAGLPDGKTLGLTLQFTGSYSEAVDFLHKVETMPYFTDVLSVSIRPVSGSSNATMPRADLFSTSAVGMGTSAQKSVTVPADGVDAEFSIIVYLE